MAATETFGQACRRHPIVKGIVSVAAFVTVAEILILLILPAWAIAVPVTSRITIDLGEAAQLVTALVAALGLWKAWKAEKKAAEAATNAAVGVVKIMAVATQVDGLLTAKVAAAKAEEKLAGEEKAATLAQGQEEGRRSAPAQIDPNVLTAAVTVAATAAAAIAAPPAAAIAAPPAAATAAPPVVNEVVPPAVDEAVRAAFEREHNKARSSPSSAD